MNIYLNITYLPPDQECFTVQSLKWQLIGLS